MHYLSRGTITRDGAFQLADYGVGRWYGAHKLVWTLFEDRMEDREFVYHYNKEEEKVFVVSPIEPNRDCPNFDLQVKSYDPKPRRGQTYRFRLTFNSAVRAGGEEHDIVDHEKYKYERGEIKGDIPPVKRRANQAAKRWLDRRESDYGFRIIENDYGQPAFDLVDYRRIEEGMEPHEIPFVSLMEVEGVLEVTDAEKLRDALLNGVYKKKAFGCGLMIANNCQREMSR